MGNWSELIRNGMTGVWLATSALSSLYFLLTLTSLLMRRFRGAPVQPMAPGSPQVTVHIPTRNELAALACAERCLAMDYPEDRLQILIGDDSNRPEISARIAEFAARNPRITVLRRPDNAGYKAGNLNHMMTRTTGEYVLVFDSDFLPDRDFLRKMVQPVLRDPELAGVQAAWRVANVHQNLTTLMGAGIVYVIHIVILPFIRRFARTGMFCGSAELIRRDLLEASGGWTPGAFTEDVDYSLRAFVSGRRIAYLEDVSCDCEVPHAPRDLFRQQMRWAYGVMRAFMSHGGALLRSRVVHVRSKIAAVCFGSGYLMIVLLLLSLFLGAANLLGGGQAAAALAEPAAAAALWLDFGGNVLWSCGLLLSSLCASFVAGVSLRNVGKLLVASLSLGVLLLFFVGKGLFRALFGLPMHWFLVRKNGNAVSPA